MTLVIDNYDSFTFNLVQYLGSLGEEVQVFRNDQITVDEAMDRSPDRILVSPGPCTPEVAGISVALIQRAAGKVPVLGVCLGHQAIGQAFGGKVVRAGRLMHGKTSPIYHDAAGVLKGIPSPFEAVRYHSLLVDRDSLPDCLRVTAESDQGELMGLRHRDHPVEGVQFHPESVVSEHGMDLLRNFLKMRA